MNTKLVPLPSLLNYCHFITNELPVMADGIVQTNNNKQQ